MFTELIILNPKIDHFNLEHWENIRMLNVQYDLQDQEELLTTVRHTGIDRAIYSTSVLTIDSPQLCIKVKS